MFLRGAAQRVAGAYRPSLPTAAAGATSPPSLRDESTLGSKTTNPTGDHVTDKILALNCSLHSSYILPWLLLLIICLVRISN